MRSTNSKMRETSKSITSRLTLDTFNYLKLTESPLFSRSFHRSTSTKCGIPTCPNNALALTAYCYLHITLNADQKLFHPCTAKFSDNSQCRVPVFDISHELPLCPEHAWKRVSFNILFVPF